MNEPDDAPQPPDPRPSAPEPPVETRPVIAKFWGVWARVKHHKVAQWTLTYLAIAYSLLNVAVVLSDSLGWPPGWIRFFTLVLILSVPIIAILAWYHGARGQQRASGTEIMIIAVLLALGGAFLWRDFRNQEQSTEDAAVAAPASPADSAEVRIAPGDKSIAVLPFADMSAGKDQEYFADGLSEELLNLLAKLPELRVIGRTSSFQFKGRNEDLRAIGEKLNVAHILEGSVRKSGDSLRISAQLIRAADGSRLWSQTYDRKFSDILIVQDEIAGEVVKTLKVALLGPQSVTRSMPTDSEAYNLTLQGRFFLERTTFADHTRAVDYFRQALERDPDFAQAWAGLSIAYAYQADSGLIPVAVGYRQAREAAMKALALDAQLADAHLAMGGIQNSYDWDWEGADGSFRRALELEPGNAMALRFAIVQAMTLGRWDEAIGMANKGIERDPLRPGSYSNLGLVLLAVNRDTEAEAAFRKALELDPDGFFWHQWLGWALILQSKADAALQEMQQEPLEWARLSGLPLVFHALGQRSDSDAALAVLKDKYAGSMAYQIAEVHAFRGEVDLAFEWLDRAYYQRDAGLADIKRDRFLRGLVSDPRFKAFLRKLELPV